jgi:hypothetical protein
VYASATSYSKLNADARLVFQFISGAIGIATAQNIFTNRLIESLPTHAPGVDAAQVLAVGGTGLRSAFTASQLPGILQSYMIGLKGAWLMSLGLSGMTFIMSLLAGWKSIKTKKKASPESGEPKVSQGKKGPSPC